MAHAAIYEKGSDQITYFIRDAVQTGRDFRGSNGSVTGVKEHCFDVLWTDDDVERLPGSDAHNRRISDLRPARRYSGHVVSRSEDVDAVTRAAIRERYSIEDEIKVMRLKLSGDETAWKEYQDFVEGLVKDGKEFKEKNFGGKT